MLPEDRVRFDELVYRRGEEPVDHHLKVRQDIERVINPNPTYNIKKISKVEVK